MKKYGWHSANISIYITGREKLALMRNRPKAFIVERETRPTDWLTPLERGAHLRRILIATSGHPTTRGWQRSDRCNYAAPDDCIRRVPRGDRVRPRLARRRAGNNQKRPGGERLCTKQRAISVAGCGGESRGSDRPPVAQKTGGIPRRVRTNRTRGEWTARARRAT